MGVTRRRTWCVPDPHRLDGWLVVDGTTPDWMLDRLVEEMAEFWCGLVGVREWKDRDGVVSDPRVMDGLANLLFQTLGNYGRSIAPFSMVVAVIRLLYSTAHDLDARMGQDPADPVWPRAVSLVSEHVMHLDPDYWEPMPGRPHRAH